MKNFDEQYEVIDVEDGQVVTRVVSRDERLTRERTFQIGGEVFTYKPSVAPEAIMPYYRMINGELLDLGEEESLKIIDGTVLAFLEPGQEEAWRKVRDPDAANPVTITDMRGLIHWLLQAQSGRPTGPSSGSSNGSATAVTATTSTDDSSSPVTPEASAT